MKEMNTFLNRFLSAPFGKVRWPGEQPAAEGEGGGDTRHGVRPPGPRCHSAGNNGAPEEY